MLKAQWNANFLVWGNMDLSPLKGVFYVHFHLKSLELIWMASESWGMARFGLYGLYWLDYDGSPLGPTF